MYRRINQLLDNSRKGGNTMLKHFVEFSYPGIFVSEYSHEEIAERKPELVNVPEDAFAYRFYDQVQTIVDGELLTGERKNYSGITYFGKVYTLEEVKAQFPEYTTLISNMKCNGWNRVVRTRKGNWQPFEDGDTVIEA